MTSSGNLSRKSAASAFFQPVPPRKYFLARTKADPNSLHCMVPMVLLVLGVWSGASLDFDVAIGIRIGTGHDFIFAD